MATFLNLTSKQRHGLKSRISALLLTLCQIATSLPINGTDDLVLPGLVGATRPSCADTQNYPKWFQPSKQFDHGDCDKARELFYNDYVRHHNGQRYEFFAPYNHPIHEIPTQRVPLKFASGNRTFPMLSLHEVLTKREALASWSLLCGTNLNGDHFLTRSHFVRHHPISLRFRSFIRG